MSSFNYAKSRWCYFDNNLHLQQHLLVYESIHQPDNRRRHDINGWRNNEISDLKLSLAFPISIHSFFSFHCKKFSVWALSVTTWLPLALNIPRRISSHSTFFLLNELLLHVIMKKNLGEENFIFTIASLHCSRFQWFQWDLMQLYLRCAYASKRERMQQQLSKAEQYAISQNARLTNERPHLFFSHSSTAEGGELGAKDDDEMTSIFVLME